MRITLNGEPRDVERQTTLAGLMSELIGSTRGSAAVIDGEVIPRREWTEFTLHEGQVVELITAVHGG